jgi:hypothetical protein
MSSSSPADLAVTFRSVSRRLREVLGDASPVDDIVQAQLSAAGAALHAAPDPDAIADAITRVPADEWDLSTLDALRRAALDIGHRLRTLAEARPRDDD